LGKELNIRILVETGTCQGSTLVALHKDFDKIYTVELAEVYHKQAVQRLREGHNAWNIEFHLGDSRPYLRELLQRIPRETPLLFWLDAHASGALSADAGDPLGEEIDIITQFHPEAVVVIDDMQDAELRHIDSRITDGWLREYRTGEIIMHRGGWVIPKFED
jgi:hypothetical protein